MGIKDRLKFIAKSYINSILDGTEARQTRSTPEADPDIHIVDEDDDFKKMSDDEFEKQWAAFEEEQRKYRAHQRAAGGAGGGQQQGPRRGGSERTLAQCYQNLECPAGSDLKVVRANFRRLMKKYHPDLQPQDKRSQEAALRITQIITESFNQLEKYLEKS